MQAGPTGRLRYTGEYYIYKDLFLRETTYSDLAIKGEYIYIYIYMAMVPPVLCHFFQCRPIQFNNGSSPTGFELG